VAAADDVIRADGLVKRYGATTAVDGVSFTVHRGEIFGMLGPNGAGKTTTVECLQGLRRVDGGSLRVLGLDPTADAAVLRRRIGSQLQDSALPDRIRVGEALAFFSSLSPLGPPWTEVMEQWNLSAKRNATFGSLSGGQQQRLFVALAMLNAPELVFLDEMTTGLDPASRRDAWQLVRRIRDEGATVVLVTHFMDEAEELCDRVAVFVDGHVAELDTPAAVAARHAPAPRITFSVEPTVDIGFLDDVPGVSAVERTGGRVTVTAEAAATVRVAAALAGHGLEPLDLDVRRGTLEDAFFAIVEPSADPTATAGG
jgi:ABC-2 type transport system ATP-binding protein